MTPIHILQPKIRGKTYQTNTLITQFMEENEYTIDYITEEAKLLGQIFAQKYNLSEGMKKFGDKGLNYVLA